MKRTKKRRQQQGCKIMEAINAIEAAASMATKIYKAAQPIIKAILRNGKTK